MEQKVLHFPRLDTILAVERIIKDSDKPLSKNGIDRKLEKKIMRPTLNLILGYLEESGKIAAPKEGIIWIFKKDISRRLMSKLRKGVTVMQNSKGGNHQVL